MKKSISLLLVLSMLLCFFVGCGGTESQSSEAPVSEAVSAPEEAPAPESPEVPGAPEASLEEPVSTLEAEEEWDPSLPYGNGKEEDWDPEAIVASVDISGCPIQFPLEEQETLSVWMSIPDMLPQDLPEGMAAHRTFMAMEELTNVKLDWTEVTTTLAATQFQLMVAGGDYTDMIFNASSMYNTGLDGAVEDEVFLPFNDYVEEYAPRFYALATYNEDIYNSATTAGGNFVSFVGFTDKKAYVDTGFVIRQDFLDAVGMDIPETYDEYHDVLAAFKSELGLAEPLYLPASVAFSNEFLVGGYGIAGKLYSMPFNSDPFYQVDGEVRYGITQPEYKDFITMVHEWYVEGLVSPDFHSTNARDCETDRVIGDDVGLFLQEGMGFTTLESFDKTNPNWDVTPLKEPVLNKGDIVHFAAEQSLVSGGGIVITTGCDNVELAVAWNDQWLCHEAVLAANYGLEGESYTMENGEPQYTELALTGRNLQVMFSNSNVGSITYRDAQTGTYSDLRIECYEVWSETRDSLYSYPSGAIMTQEENEEYARINADIHTFAEENIAKFVTGERDLAEFDTFVQDLISMDLDAVIAIKQAALDRYLGA